VSHFLYSNLPAAFVPNSVFSLQMSLKNCRGKTISINFDALNLTKTERDAVCHYIMKFLVDNSLSPIVSDGLKRATNISFTGKSI
jgi:hypothetical protein